jgi:hypothetical protein
VLLGNHCAAIECRIERSMEDAAVRQQAVEEPA